MIPLHDRVHVTYQIATGDYDSHGNPITANVDIPDVPASVWPLGSSDDARDLSGLARYRMVLDRTAGIPAAGWSSLTLRWGQFDGTTLNALTVDGTIDEVRVLGRTHHYELTTKAVV